MQNKLIVLFAFVLLAGIALANPSCGDNISVSTTLTADLLNCPANGLNISADNVILDCNGHTIEANYSAFYIYGQNNTIIKNCNISNSAVGIQLWQGSSNSTITNNTFYNNSDGAYLGYSAMYNNFTGNSFYNQISNALDFGDDSNFTTIHDNFFYGNDNAIEAYGSQSSNYFSIVNNSILNSLGNGIYFSTASFSNITNNTFSGSALYDAVDFEAYSDNNNISNNVIYNNNVSGLKIQSCSNDIVANNLIYGNGESLYLKSSTYNNISNNIIYNNNGTAGIYLEAATANNNLANNLVYNNNYSGIYAKTSGYNTFTNNTVYNNDKYGIWTSATAQYNVFDGNRIFNHSLHGIAISAGGRYDNITNNLIYNNGQNGISFNTNHNNTITNNTIYNCSNYGIYLSASNTNNLSDNVIFNNGYGIVSNNSFYNLFNNISSYNNTRYGISINIGQFNVITNSRFYGNNIGFWNSASGNNILTNVSTYNNTLYGIYLATSVHQTNFTNTYSCFNTVTDIYDNDTNSFTNSTCDSGVNMTCDQPCPLLPLTCGDNITSNTILTADILNCSGNGLNIQSDNITIDCNNLVISGDGSFAGNGININGNNVTIKNCEIYNFTEGILSNYSEGTYLNNSLHDNLDSNLYLSNSANDNITSNIIFNSQYNGIYATNSPNVYIENNNISNNAYEGIDLVAGSTNATIINNLLETNLDYNIIADSSDYATIYNNTITNSLTPPPPMSYVSQAGIEMISNYANISSNYFYHCYGDAIGNWGNNNTIYNNTFYENNVGIEVNGNDNNVTNNILTNGNIGLNLYNIPIGGRNYIENNQFDNQSTQAIGVTWSADCTIYNNTITNASQYGMLFYGNKSDIYTLNNYFINDANAVYFYGSNGNYFNGNILHDNGNGFLLQTDSKNNNITNNTLYNNGNGIYFYQDSNNNIVTDNTIYNSSGAGFGFSVVSQSNNNTIYNNILNNTQNVAIIISYNNTWNTTKTLATNIIGGMYTGGNYWADPSGTGYSETCTDANADGICDTPYTISGFDIDYLPLTVPPLPLTCGDNITSDTILSIDLLNCPANGLNISADNVILDCNGHTIEANSTYPNSAFYIYGQNNTIIKNCNISNSAAGIQLLQGSSNTTITNNTFYNNSDGAYLGYSAMYNNFTGNSFYNQIGNALDFGDDSNFTTIHDNFFYGNNNAIKAYGTKSSNYFSIVNNSIQGSIDTGIYFKSSAFSNVTNNTISGSITQNGIYLLGTNYVNISNNIIYNNNLSGIYTQGNSNDNIANNLIYNNSIYGIRANGGSNFTNNTIYENRYGFYGFSMTSANVLNNLIHDNTVWGIYTINSGNYNTFSGNSIYNNLGGGIGLNVSQYCNITNNLVYNNTGNGIYFEKNIRYDNITNNSFYNNTGNGILVYAGSRNNTFANNHIYSNLLNGIQINYSSYNNTLISNSIYNNSNIGIYIQNATNTNFTNNYIYNNSNIGLYLDSLSKYSTSFNTYSCFNTVTDIYDNDTNSFTNSTCDSGVNMTCDQPCPLLPLTCGVLTTPDTTYTLISDLDGTGFTYCLDVQANNVTIDCNGFTIENSTTSEIYSNGYNQTTINNCVINSVGSGISLNTVDNATITNANIVTNLTCIESIGSTNLTILDSFCDTSASQGFYLQGTGDDVKALIRNNTIIGDGAVGDSLLYLQSVSNATVCLNNFTDTTIGYYIQTVFDLGDNSYNCTYNGLNQGNIYGNILATGISGSVNSSISGLYIGTTEYNETTSFENVSSQVHDYAPLTPIYSPSTPPTCGDNITSNTILTADILNCSGNGLNVNTNNVILDCNGHAISGLFTNNGIEISSVNNITIENCNISNFQYGIAISSSNYDNFLNNDIWNVTTNALVFMDSRSDVIDSNQLHNNSAGGIWFNCGGDDCNETNITNNVIYGNDWGIDLSHSQYDFIFNNTLTNMGDAAFKIQSSTNNNTFYNNNATANQYGFYFANGNSYDNNISYNDIYSNTAYNVRTDWGFTAPLNVSLNYWGVQSCMQVSSTLLNSSADIYYQPILNDTYQNGGVPISCNATLSCGTISSSGIYNLTNDLFASGDDCFKITAPDITIDCAGWSVIGDGTGGTDGFNIQANNITIENCNITQFTQAGISIAWANNGTFYNNTIQNNTAFGIQIGNSMDNNATKNYIYNNSYDGINLNTAQNTLIDSNILVDNHNSGILLSASTLNTLLSNQISNSYAYGIEVDSNSLYNNITNNSIHDNNGGKAGIEFRDSDNNFASYNEIFNNGADGILVDTTHDNITNTTLFGNVIHDNLMNGYGGSNMFGIHLINSNDAILDSNIIYNQAGNTLLLAGTSNNYTIQNNQFYNTTTLSSAYVASLSPVTSGAINCDEAIAGVPNSTFWAWGGGSGGQIVTVSDTILNGIHPNTNWSVTCINASIIDPMFGENATFYLDSSMGMNNCSDFNFAFPNATCYGFAKDVLISQGAGNNFLFSGNDFNSTFNISAGYDNPTYLHYSLGSITSGIYIQDNSTGLWRNNNFTNASVQDTSSGLQIVGYGSYNNLGGIIWQLYNFSFSGDLGLGINVFNDINTTSFTPTPSEQNLNTSAIIGVGGLTFPSTPMLMKDGVRCDNDSSLCNITSYGGGILTADVSGFSNYTAEENPNLVCDQTIISSETLNGSLFCYGTNGINILGNGITFDCNGYSIIGDGSSYGVYVNVSDNVIIKNCDISNFSSAIYIDTSNYTTIENNLLHDNIYGTNAGSVQLYNTSNSLVQNNNINTNKIGLIDYIGTNNTVYNNTFSNNDAGIGSLFSYLDNFSNNNIFGSAQIGVLLSEGTYNTISHNNLTNDANAIFLTAISQHNSITDNVIANNNESGIITGNFPDMGVYDYNNSFNNIERNNFTNNAVAMNFINSTNNTITNNNILFGVIMSAGTYTSSFSPVTANGIDCTDGATFINASTPSTLFLGYDSPSSPPAWFEAINISGQTLANANVSVNYSVGCIDDGSGNHVTVYFDSGFGLNNCSDTIIKLGVTNCYGFAKDVLIGNGTGNNFLFDGAGFNSTFNITPSYDYPLYLNYTNGSVIGNQLSIVDNNSFAGYGYDANINAISNYWGTTNITLIQNSIFDYKNDSSVGNVSFMPFLTSPYPSTLSGISWNETPTNQIIVFNVPFSYQVNATSSSLPITYGLNDTSKYTINATTGVITNSTIVPVGVYYLNITATDLISNSISQNISITVNSTPAPLSWTQTPINRTNEYGSPFNYDINATSGFAPIIYSINDTTNFTINTGTGIITNTTFLPIGTYHLKVNATDTSPTTISQDINITIQDTIKPIITDNLGLSNGTTYNTNKLLNYTFYDLNSYNTSLYVNGTLVNSTITSGTVSLTYLLADGSYNISINTTDLANNTRTLLLSNIAINTTIPTVVIPISTAGGWNVPPGNATYRTITTPTETVNQPQNAPDLTMFGGAVLLLLGGLAYMKYRD